MYNTFLILYLRDVSLNPRCSPAIFKVTYTLSNSFLLTHDKFHVKMNNTLFCKRKLYFIEKNVLLLN